MPFSPLSLRDVTSGRYTARSARPVPPDRLAFRRTRGSLGKRPGLQSRASAGIVTWTGCLHGGYVVDLDVTAAVADLGIRPLDLEPGDVIEGAVILLKVGNAEDGASLHRVISPGLTHWETVGMLTDSLDSVRWDGIQAEDG